MEEEEERRKARKRKKGRIRELEEASVTAPAATSAPSVARPPCCAARKMATPASALPVGARAAHPRLACMQAGTHTRRGVLCVATLQPATSPGSGARAHNWDCCGIAPADTI